MSRIEPSAFSRSSVIPWRVGPPSRACADQGLVVGEQFRLEAETLRQGPEDVVVRAALAARGDRRRVVHHVEVAVRAVDVDMLELRRGRQDDIGIIDGVGGEQLVDDDEEVVPRRPASTLAWLGATAAGLQL